MKAIVETMRDCNKPDVEPQEMSRMLLEKKELISDMDELVGYMEEEANVFDVPEVTDVTMKIYSETQTLISHLKEMSMKVELTPDEIKAYCTELVDVIKHVLDITQTVDKWAIGIAIGYIDTLNTDMIKALKQYKDIGPLDQKQLDKFVYNTKVSVSSISQFTETRATVYSDDKALIMKEVSTQLQPSYSRFINFIRGASGNKQDVVRFKDYLKQAKKVLQDPFQFKTSIDVTSTDELDTKYTQYKNTLDDPTIGDDEKEEASLALLEGFEGRATANLSSSDPKKARAATAVIKCIHQRKDGKKRKEMLEVARALANDMKTICDHLEPLDYTLSRDMDDVTNELLGGIDKKLDGH